MTRLGATGIVFLLNLERGLKSLSDNYHPAWSIVATATLLQVTTNFIGQAFAILIVVLREEFAWSLTAITLAYFLRSIVSAILSPLAGWMGDRYGARSSLIAATGLYAAGLFMLGTLEHIWQLYLYYSLMLGISQSMFRINIPTTVAAWFKRRLGIAVGIQQSAGGMGTSVMAPLLAVVLSRMEWQTAFWIIAPVASIIILALLWRFHGDPQDRGLAPYGADENQGPTASTEPGVAQLRAKTFLRQAKRTRAFWNLILIHHLGCVGHSIVIVSVVFYATTRGLGLEQAAFIVSIYGLASVTSRFATPVLADHLGAKGVMALAYFVQGITVALLLWTNEPWQFFLFAALFGVGMGGEMSAFLVINRQYYGMGPVRTIFGFQSMGAGTGMALGGLLGGVIFDITGTYTIAWLVSIAASIGGAVSILFLEPTSKLLMPDWEEALPPEARTQPAPAASGD